MASGAAILVTDNELSRPVSPSSLLMRTTTSNPGCDVSKPRSRWLRSSAERVPALGSNCGGSHMRKTLPVLEEGAVEVDKG
ncbi:MAG TPA: hypothetical protein VJ022_15330 [Anaerolineales bacterium]|nr:hypothetical protein [Anaerolineales bacterium]